MEKEIFYIGTRSFTKKKTNETFFIVDYVELESFVPYSDYISASEFTDINKKMGNKHFEKCVAKFSINSYKNAYVSSIK